MIKRKFSKTVKPLLLLLILMTAAVSCVKEQGDLTHGKGKFSISYSFDNIQTMGVSAQSNERVINDACLIFYKEANGRYVAHSTAVVNSGVGSFSLTVPDAIITGEKYRVLVVGNYNHFPAAGQSIDDYIGANTGKNYTQMREVMFSQSPASARMSTPLPFSGILLGTDGQESLFTGPTANAQNLGVSVKFSRTVSRFNLRNMAADKLVIEWVKVCNYCDRGCFFHSDSPVSSVVIPGTASISPSKPYPVGYETAPVSDGKQNFNSGGLYAYPNTVSHVTQNDKLTTCLMIAGYYQTAGELANTTKLTYYRTNIASNQANQLLKQNCIYTVVINDVKSEGADSEDGAIAEDDRLLDYMVNNNSENNDGDTAVDDKGNYLTVSHTNVILDSPAGESAIIKVAVKPGSVWSIAWTYNPEGVFTVAKIDDSSFRITSNSENDISLVKNGLLTVTVDGTALVMEINVMQLSSQYVIAVSPKYSNTRPLIIEGFTSTTGNPNGLAYSQLFMVSLANPTQYTFKVESSFNKNADAYLSLNTPILATSSYRENNAAKNQLTAVMNESIFYLNAFRTAPGDPVIRGNIKVTAVPTAGSGLLEQSLSFPVEIRTSCDIDDIKLGDFTVADRNVNAQFKPSVALNYTNDPIHPDNMNGLFKGSYTPWNVETLNTLCTNHGISNYTGENANGWIPPTSAQQVIMTNRMIFSKERAFIVSDTKTPGNRAVGCFFPLSGQTAKPNEVTGAFWSTDVSGGNVNFRYYLKLLPNSSSSVTTNYTNGFSVRCVK